MVRHTASTHMRRMLPSVWSSRSMTIVIALGTFVSGVTVTLPQHVLATCQLQCLSYVHNREGSCAGMLAYFLTLSSSGRRQQSKSSGLFIARLRQDRTRHASIWRPGTTVVRCPNSHSLPIAVGRAASQGGGGVPHRYRGPCRRYRSHSQHARTTTSEPSVAPSHGACALGEKTRTENPAKCHQH